MKQLNLGLIGLGNQGKKHFNNCLCLEETTVLGVPCITLRNNTERPVTLEQGTNFLVSTDKDKVVKKSLEIINDKIKINKKIPELWDGKAAQRIVDVILNKIQ